MIKKVKSSRQVAKKPESAAKTSKKEAKQPTKIISIVCKILVTLGVLTLLVLMVRVAMIGVLPVKYLVPLLIIATIVMIVLMLMVWLKKSKTWLRIVAGVLSLLMMGLSIFGLIKIGEITNFLDDNLGAGAEVDVAEEPFIMYISGIDVRDGTMPEKARSDLNILAVVSPKKHKILMVNVPRDYYVKLHGLDAYDKLTHAGDIGGLELSKTTIEDLLDVKIDTATRVNFNLLGGLVEAVGGITVNSGVTHDYKLYWNKDCVIHEGLNELNGECAVAYARERVAVGGDLHRAENQEQVITAILDKISSDKSILMNYSEILNSLDGTFETTLSTSDVMGLVRAQLGDMKGWQVEQFNLSTAGDGQEYGYLYPDEKHFVFYVDQDSVNKAHERIVEFMNEA